MVGGAHSSAIPEQTIREFPHFDIVAFQEEPEPPQDQRPAPSQAHLRPAGRGKAGHSGVTPDE